MRSYIDLMEEMAYQVLEENDQRATWIAQNMGGKLLKAYRAQQAAGEIPPAVHQVVEPESEMQDEAIIANIVSIIVKADPTPNKAYARWIASRFTKSRQRLEDVGEGLKRNLEVFAQAAAGKRVDANIDKIKSFAELFNVVQPFLTGDRETSSRKDKEKGRETSIDTRVERKWDVDDPMREQAEVFHDSNDYMIVIPKTQEASNYFGVNTNWCTVGNNTTYFNHYSKDGPLYIVLRRHDGKRWQFHFPSHQFMDESDARIQSMREWAAENKEAFDAFGIENIQHMLGFTDIGLSFFPKEVINTFDSKALARGCAHIEDVMYVPENIRLTTNFAHEVVERGSRSNPEFKEAIINYYIAHVDSLKTHREGELGGYSVDLVVESIIKRGYGTLMHKLPERFHTDYLKKIAAEHYPKSKEMEDGIPKPWPPEVYEQDYENRVTHNNILYTEVPEEYQNGLLLLYAIMYQPDTWDEIIHEVEPRDIVDAIDKLQISKGQFRDWPDEWHTPAFAKAIIEEAKDKYSKPEDNEFWRVLASFPHPRWPKGKAARANVAIHAPWSNMPGDLMTEEFAAKWANVFANKDYYDTIPPRLATENVAYKTFCARGDWRAIARMPLSDEQVLNVMNKVALSGDLINEHKSHVSKTSGFEEEWLQEHPQFMEGAIRLGYIAYGSIPEEDCTPINIGLSMRSGLTTVGQAIKNSRPRGHYRATTFDEVMGEITQKSKYLGVRLDKVQKVDEDIICAIAEYGHPEVVFTEQAKKFYSPKLAAAVANTTDVRKNDESKMAAQTCFAELKNHVDSEALGFAIANKLVDAPKISANPYHSKLFTGRAFREAIDNWGIRELLAQDWDKIDINEFKAYIAESVGNHDNAVELLEDIIDLDVVFESCPLLTDPEIALMLLTAETDYENQHYRAADYKIQKVYKNFKTRVNWGQEHYNLTAGDIAPYREIPEKFRTTEVRKRAAETDPDNIHDIEGDAFDHLPTKDMKSTDLQKTLKQGMTQHDGQWVDIRKEKPAFKNGKGRIVVTKFNDYDIAFLFDKKGEVVTAICPDGLAASVSKRDHFTGGSFNFTNKREFGGDDNLSDYRPLLADLFRSEFAENSFHNDYPLQNIRIYKDKDYNPRPVENHPRKQVAGDVYMVVEGPFHDRTHFLFDGEKGEMIGAIQLKHRDMGYTFVTGALRAAFPMKRAIELANDLASSFEKLQITSGSTAAFKESAFYEKLGMRGPGYGKWLTSLHEKVAEKETEQGVFQLWKRDHLLSVVLDDSGIIAYGKILKKGMKLSKLNGPIGERFEEEIRSFFK